jgi:putative hydrolase
MAECSGQDERHSSRQQDRERIVGVTEHESAVVDRGPALDLTTDAHVHTGFAAGRDSIGVIVSVADRALLTAVTFADQVGPDSTWLPAYAEAIRRASGRTEVALRVGAEVEVVRTDGWLAWPAALDPLESVSVAVSRLPLAGGLLQPGEIRSRLESGELTAEQVTEAVVAATANGMERASRYVPTRLARPLNLLTQVGLDDSALSEEAFDQLVDACAATGTVLEISEAWHSPSPRMVARLRMAGVPMVAASDARYAEEVGRWRYLRRV